MIDIYTEKKDSKDWILQNDLYFNLNTSNEEAELICYSRLLADMAKVEDLTRLSEEDKE